VRIRTALSALSLAAAILLAPLPGRAALIGLSPSDATIDFGASGVIDYDATTGVVTISGTPTALFRPDPFLFGQVFGTGPEDEKLITVQFRVDASGNLVSGVDGPDLIIKGSIDVDFDGVADYDGILLQAEVTQFGFQNGASGGNDFFDLRLNNITGALAPLFAGDDLALSVLSEVTTEYPNPFSNSFTADFLGQAQGVVGAVDPIVAAACKLDVEAYCSVGGERRSSKCRIKKTKSPHHWNWEDRFLHGVSHYRRYTYGMHGLPVPGWASQHSSTEVKFTYVIKNTGTTPVGNLVIDDSFDTPVTGLPATLAPGQRVRLTRTERLREPLEDIVMVAGEYQSARCADVDTVVIREKLRDRRRHDDDHYREKDRDDRHRR
jgi:hypothetical protein